MGKRPSVQPLERQDAEHLVAVDEVAVSVNGHTAVGVAIQREPDVGAMRSARLP